MNQDDVIKWAREAGLHIATDVHWMPLIGLKYLEKVAAIAYEAGRKDENAACVEAIKPNATPMEIATAIRARREQ